MGLINMATKIPTLMMKLSSSIFPTGSSSFLAAAGTDSFLSVVFNFLAKIFYFAAKWMLYLLDILYAYIKELCGLNMSYESLEKMVSKESDFVFNLLITSRETITPIIKSLIGLVIALVIFFAILAVIKTTFNSIKQGATADIKGVFRNTFKAFILLVITPMLAIVGIVAANTILKTLYNATNPSGSTSISTQLFSASATSASSYRIYAQNGLKIPITYDFTEQETILEYYQNHPLTDDFREYVISDKNLIYTNYKRLQEGNFDEFIYLNDAISSGTGVTETYVSRYYQAYDRSAEAVKPVSPYHTYKRIQAYKSEYLVMADVIDYCINSGNTLYFKTIQEVLDSVAAVPDDSVFESFVTMFDIEFLTADLKTYVLSSIITTNADDVNSTYNSYKQIYNHDSWQVIRFNSTYYDANESTEPTRKMVVQYNHVKDATDELQGAKYIVASEQVKTIYDAYSSKDKEYRYFYPITLGYGTGSGGAFDTDFIQMGQIVAAKGIFSEGKYPTAIRQSEDGAELQFYRETISQVNVGDESGMAGGSLATEEKKSGIAGFFQKLKAMFSPKVNLSVDENAVITAYGIEEIQVNILSAGKLNISYMFSDAISNGLGGIMTAASRAVSGQDNVEQIGIFGLNLDNLFIPNKLNILVLIVGAFVMIKITFQAVFALINRSYELFLTIIVYPTACATIPLDENGFQQWTITYTQRLFSTYGLILGLNFVIMLFPIISELEVFTAGEIALSKPLMRFRNLFSLGGLITISLEFLASFLNLIVVILFELVAFTLLETIPETISKITGVSAAQGFDPIEAMGKVLNVIMGVVKTVGSSGSGVILGIFDVLGAFVGSKKSRDKAKQRIKQKVKDKTDKLKKGAKSMIPGKGLVDSIKDKQHVKQQMGAQKEAMNKLKDAMDNKDSDPKAVQDAMSNLLQAQQKATAAINDPSGSRAAAESEKKQNEDAGLDEDGEVSSREGEEDDDKDGADLSHRSKSSLKKEKKRAKAVVKNLKKKEKAGGVLSANEQAALKRQEGILKNTTNALKQQKTDSKDDKQAKKTIRQLTKAQGKGQLTQTQTQELAAAQQTLADSKTRKQNHAATRKKEKDDIKQKHADAKEDAKKAERLRAFSHMDMGSRMAQKGYLKEMEKEQTKLQQQLNESGLNLNLAQLTQDQYDKIGTGFYTAAQEKIIKDYVAKEQEKNALIDMTGEDYIKAKAQRKANYAAYKNQDLAGKHGLNVVKTIQKKALNKKLNGNYMQNKNELAAVSQQLQNFGNVDSSNIRAYNQLKQKQAELQARLDTAQKWNDRNAMSPAQRKAADKNQQLRDKWEREAMLELRATNQAMTRENLDKVMARKRQEAINKRIKRRR